MSRLSSAQKFLPADRAGAPPRARAATARSGVLTSPCPLAVRPRLPHPWAGRGICCAWSFETIRVGSAAPADEHGRTGHLGWVRDLVRDLVLVTTGLLAVLLATFSRLIYLGWFGPIGVSAAPTHAGGPGMGSETAGQPGNAGELAALGGLVALRGDGEGVVTVGGLRKSTAGERDAG
jgi:hypothetical protein